MEIEMSLRGFKNAVSLAPLPSFALHYMMQEAYKVNQTS